MYGIGVPELAIVGVWLLVLIVSVALLAVVLYFVVRKAVRDGIRGARKDGTEDG